MEEQKNWKERFEKKHWGAMFEDGDYNKLIEDIEQLLSSQAHALKEQMKAKVKNMKVSVFIAVTDNDGHRYQIPTEKREEWYKWTEIPSADPESWDVPEYAERIDGMDVKQPDFREQTLSVIESIEI